MKSRICFSLIFGLLLLVPGRICALAAIPIAADKDTVINTYFYFPFNQDEVTAGYPGNDKTILLLDSLFNGKTPAMQPDSVVITSLVLSEGSPKFNIWLAEHRSLNVRDYLINHYPSLKTHFVLCRKEVDWNDFYNLIAGDSAIPDREDVIRLIDFHHDNPEKCKRLIRYLNGGKAYHYITNHLLPLLHQTEVRIYPNYFGFVVSLSEMEPVTLPSSKEDEEIAISLLADTMESSPLITLPIRRKTVIAIKNNLLYDIALAPNLELEIPVGRHWSINTEFKCPWWLSEKDDFCYQLLSGGVESRLWLGSRHRYDPLIGHFLGLYAEGGKYDFQFWESDGIQGDYYAAGGLSYGYTKRIARHFSLEFSFGVGFMYSKYHTYTSSGGSLLQKDLRRCAYVGPTKAKISLVWLIGAK